MRVGTGSLVIIRTLNRIGRAARRYAATGRFRATPLNASDAYDLWAELYDDQPHNILIAMDDALFADLVATSSLKQKRIVDVGCGTGRHWDALFAGEPYDLIGYDTSVRMLDRLRRKHLRATLRLTTDHRLPGLRDQSCDLVITTLTFGYLPDHRAAMAEWARVLDDQGEIILTDLHPSAAAKGNRSFHHRGMQVAIRHYVHPLASVLAAADDLGFEVLRFEERCVDDLLKPLFEAQHALPLFQRVYGHPMTYGLRLRKRARLT